MCDLLESLSITMYGKNEKPFCRLISLISFDSPQKEEEKDMRERSCHLWEKSDVQVEAVVLHQQNLRLQSTHSALLVDLRKVTICMSRDRPTSTRS